MSEENNVVTKKVTKLDQFLSILSVISVSAMVILVFINAVLRYGFNSGLTSAEEYSRFAFVWLCYLGIILAAKEGSHVSVTIVTDNIKGMTLKVFNILRDIIVLITMGVVLYGGALFTLASNYKTAATATNFILIASSIVLAAISVLIITVRDLIRDIKKREGDK